MECVNMLSRRTLLTAAAFFLYLFSVSSGMHCSLPEMTGAPEDYLSICAMCSDTDAAVRWTLRGDAQFDILLLQYSCSHSNRTEMRGFIEDSCFQMYPNWRESLTGTTGVGYNLSAGVECHFSVGYRLHARTITKSASCTMKSPEVCAEDPEECTIDRISELNVDGECEVQCAAGLTGDLCNNINECADGSNGCDANADCIDTDGSYWCQCLPGFHGDGLICTNTNECADGSNGCGGNADCIDTDGSYWCQCLPGFHGDGLICTNTNECADGSNGCGGNADCIDTDGSYWCQCLSGFTGDEYNCTDIDECQFLSEKCAANAECLNNEGSYSCQCKPGFTRDAYNYCSDINECENVTCGENGECINTEGNYSCQSKSGFTGDGYNCTDIDECVVGLHSCTDRNYCTNLIGSYYCKSNGVTPIKLTAMLVGILCGILLLITLLFLTLSHQYKQRNWRPTRTSTLRNNNIQNTTSAYEAGIIVPPMGYIQDCYSGNGKPFHWHESFGGNVGLQDKLGTDVSLCSSEKPQSENERSR